MVKYYNARVRKKLFRRSDLVLRRVFLSSKELGVGKLGPNWEGSYLISYELRLETFKIKNLDGKVQSHP